MIMGYWHGGLRQQGGITLQKKAPKGTTPLQNDTQITTDDHIASIRKDIQPQRGREKSERDQWTGGDLSYKEEV